MNKIETGHFFEFNIGNNHCCVKLSVSMDIKYFRKFFDKDADYYYTIEQWKKLSQGAPSLEFGYYISLDIYVTSACLFTMDWIEISDIAYIKDILEEIPITKGKVINKLSFEKILIDDQINKCHDNKIISIIIVVNKGTINKIV